jgi:hypothetical protein
MGGTLGSGRAASAGNRVPASRPLARAQIMFFLRFVAHRDVMFKELRSMGGALCPACAKRISSRLDAVGWRVSIAAIRP